MKQNRALMAIALIALAFVPSFAFAQHEGPTMKLVEFSIDQISVPDSAHPGGYVTGYNHYVFVDEIKLIPPEYGTGLCTQENFAYHSEWSVNLCEQGSGPNYTGTELHFLDFLATLPGHQWVRTGVEWTVWKLGTPGTVPVHRIYMPTLNSHVIVAEGERDNDPNQTEILSELAADPATYHDDGKTFGVKLPVNGVCPTGTTEMRRIYNGGYFKAQNANASYHYNDGNHRFFTSWMKYEETMAKVGWEIARIDADVYSQSGLICLPAQATFIKVGNDHPATMDQNGLKNYVSSYSFVKDTMTSVGLTGGPRKIDVDMSRNALFVSQKINRLNAIDPDLEVTPYMLGSDTTIFANPVDERTGKVYIVESYDANNGNGSGVWVFDPKNPNATRIYVIPPLSRDFGEAAAYATVENGVLYVLRVTQPAGNYYSKGALLTYDIRKGISRRIELPDTPYHLAYDSVHNVAYVSYANPDVDAKGFAKIDLVNGTVGNTIYLPTDEVNGTHRPRRIAVDTALNRFYVADSRWDLSLGTVKGKVHQYNLTNGAWERSIVVGYEPDDIQFVPWNGKNVLAVLNRSGNAYSPGPDDFGISLVDPVTFLETKRIPTEQQPGSMKVVTPR